MQYRYTALRAIFIALSLFLLFGMLNIPAEAQGTVRRAGSRSVRTGMLVSSAWLAGNLSNPRVVVLCVARDRKAYDDGHIPGARFIAWSDIVASGNGAANELPSVAHLAGVFEKAGIGDSARIVIYGDGNGLSATRAFFTLDYLGHGNRASILDGGIERWKSEKRTLETEAPVFSPAGFTPRPNPSVIATTETVRDYSWVSSNIDKSGVSIIDSRPAEQYAGAPSTKTGHIPGAANLYWQKHLDEKDRATVKPVSELIKMYQDLGVKSGDKVVTYCNSGVQASHSYFILKYLGFDVSMYDGSFSEWTKMKDAPISTGSQKK